MARDFLAVQGSATPSERAFSNASLTDTKRRNRISPSLFEALQILKSAYRNGHLSASDAADKYHSMLMEDYSMLGIEKGDEGNDV